MRPRGTRSAHGERPSEFKARAIDLCRSSEGLTIADVARGLGIGTKTFRKGGRSPVKEAGRRRVGRGPPGSVRALAARWLLRRAIRQGRGRLPGVDDRHPGSR